jgi:hypothetical protein
MREKRVVLARGDRFAGLGCFLLVCASTVLVVRGAPIAFAPTAIAFIGLHWMDRRWPGTTWAAGTFLAMVPLFVVMIVNVASR